MRNRKQNPLYVFLLNLLLVAVSSVILWLYPSNSTGFYLLLLTGCVLPFNGCKALSSFLSARQRNTDPAGAIVFQKERADVALVTVACLGLAGAAYGIASGAVSPHRLSVSGAMVSVVFLGLVSLASIWILIRGPLKVVLSNEGIHYKIFGPGVIPWHAIRDVRPGSVVTKDYLALELYEPEVYMPLRAPRYQRAARADHKRGLSLFTLMPWLYGADTTEMKNALEEHIHRYGKKRARLDAGSMTILKETE